MKNGLLRASAVPLALLSGFDPVMTSRPEKEPGSGFTLLFPKDGIPEGWVVRTWNDVSKPPSTEVVWNSEDGTLRGSEPRGAWLMSVMECGDFILELEFKLGLTGNSRLALSSAAQSNCSVS